MSGGGAVRNRWLEIATTPAVKAAQARLGSRAGYARFEDDAAPVTHDALGEAEAAFIGARDGFYLASVSETGWPYVQYRGGPAGFVRVLDDRTLGWADFRGNRQYVSVGNIAGGEGRLSLFLMDCANRRRLKVFGRAEIRDVAEDAALAERLAVPGYRAKVERAVLVRVAAFDWNCPQHITPRFTLEEVQAGLAPLQERLAELEAENVALRARLGGVCAG